MFDLNALVVPGLIAVAGFFAAKFLLRKDTEKENRRRGAIKLASALDLYGLPKFSKFVADYAVGDYSGMAHTMGDMARLALEGEDVVLKELDQAFKRMIEGKLKSDEGRSFVKLSLQEAEEKIAKAKAAKDASASA